MFLEHEDHIRLTKLAWPETHPKCSEQSRTQSSARDKSVQEAVQIHQDELMRSRRHREHLNGSIVEFHQVIAVEREVPFFAHLALSAEQAGHLPSRFRFVRPSNTMAENLIHGFSFRRVSIPSDLDPCYCHLLRARLYHSSASRRSSGERTSVFVNASKVS